MRARLKLEWRSGCRHGHETDLKPIAKTGGLETDTARGGLDTDTALRNRRSGHRHGHGRSGHRHGHEKQVKTMAATGGLDADAARRNVQKL